MEILSLASRIDRTKGLSEALLHQLVLLSWSFDRPNSRPIAGTFCEPSIAFRIEGGDVGQDTRKMLPVMLAADVAVVKYRNKEPG